MTPLEQALTEAPEDLAGARRVARRFHEELDLDDLDALLWTGGRQARLVAVLLLVQRFREAGDPERAGEPHRVGDPDAVRAAVLEQYLAAAHGERIDDPELVDAGAEHIVGAWYRGRPHGPVFALAKSDVVWERRIAVMATLAFVKQGDTATALEVITRLEREHHEAVASAVLVVRRAIAKRA